MKINKLIFPVFFILLITSPAAAFDAAILESDGSADPTSGCCG